MRPESWAGPLAPNEFKVDSIDLYITGSCNRRCTFCFLPDAFLDSRSRMSVEMARGIMAWAAAGDINEITVLGGEPAAHPKFADIVVEARRHGRSVRTVTNGSARFRRALDNHDVADALSRVAVSIDAPGAVAVDRLRGKGAFADAMSTVGKLRDIGMPFDINCTVVRSCLDSFPAMLAFAEDAGADRLNVHWYSPVGRGREHAPDETVSATAWREILEHVRRHRPAGPGYVVDCELSFAYDLPGEDPHYCAIRQRENLQFFPSGAVFSCGLLVEDETLSGYQWLDGHLYEKTGPTEVTRAAGCTGCPYRQSVDGVEALCIYNRLVV
jgi:MoaA/NifB/PqqE/SkfB family radical SAM enzyme